MSQRAWKEAEADENSQKSHILIPFECLFSSIFRSFKCVHFSDVPWIVFLSAFCFHIFPTVSSKLSSPAGRGRIYSTQPVFSLLYIVICGCEKDTARFSLPHCPCSPLSALVICFRFQSHSNYLHPKCKACHKSSGCACKVSCCFHILLSAFGIIDQARLVCRFAFL